MNYKIFMRRGRSVLRREEQGRRLRVLQRKGSGRVLPAYPIYIPNPKNQSDRSIYKKSEHISAHYILLIEILSVYMLDSSTDLC